ncbi:hypothetical protein Ancab_007774 [Ancistrocladus abbreviatus]
MRCKEVLKGREGKVAMVHVVENHPSNFACESDMVVSIEKGGPAHTQTVPNSLSVGDDKNRGRFKKAHYSGTLRLGQLGQVEGLLEVQASQQNLLTQDGKEMIGK